MSARDRDGMADQDLKLDLYRLYLGTAEKVSDRRGAANQWLLSVNSAVVALYGLLSTAIVGTNGSGTNAWTWAIPLAGIIVCVTWAALIDNYSKLNSAKFLVLQEIERDLPYQLFTTERQYYKAARRGSLSRLERAVPWSFASLHLLLLLFAIVA